jgi:hypothetical protein
MKSLLEAIIPDSIDDLVSRLEKDSNEQYNLTLLHKTKDSIYCFLSDNLQGITPNQKIRFGMSLAFSKGNDVEAYYDAEFEKRQTAEGYYFLFKHDSPMPKDQAPKILPFEFKEDNIPYAIVDKRLKDMLTEYVEMDANMTLEMFSTMGDHGAVGGQIRFMFNGKTKRKAAEIREYGKMLKARVTDLFHEEKSPSTLIHPKGYLLQDRSKKTMFAKKIPYKQILQVGALVPFIAAAPISALTSEFEKDFTVPYENRFKLDKSKEEEAQIILSDFAAGHPKVIKGMIRMLESIKHTANVANYAGLVSISALAYQYGPPAIGYLMLGISAASGMTMLNNAISSQGRDSGGLVSSLLEEMLYITSKLEKNIR